MTPAVRKLHDDAVAAGYLIGEGHARFEMYDDRRAERASVLVYFDEQSGAFISAHRTDVLVSIALKIRTIKQVREILELGP